MGSSQDKEPVDHGLAGQSNSRGDSHDFLQSVIDSSLDIIQLFTAIRDENGKIIDFVWRIQNARGRMQNGEVIGASLLEKNIGVKAAGIFDRMVKVAETGVPSEDEQFYSHEQFKEQWFYQALVKQDDGVLMTTRDITFQKQATIDISQQAHFIHSVTSAVPGIIVVASYPGGEVVYNNRTSFLFSGVDIRTLVKPEAFSRLLPEYAVARAKYHDRFLSIYDDMENIAELKVADAEGKTVWIQLRGSVYSRDENGEVTSTLHIAQNITKQKETELKIIEVKEHMVQRSLSRYLTLFNSIEEGYCIIQLIFDEKGRPYNWRFLEVNPAFERHNSLSNATGKTMLETMPAVAQNRLQAFEKVSETGEQLRFRDKDLSGKTVEISAFQIGDPVERTIAVIYTYQPSTDA
ncbi:MAG: hypothetical protein EOO02_00160 [Chitinophagaceae bacterium]|nr:MAG: hypothetical protein EOO02_00160 [Chitinophagaceae bacterium]